MDRRLSTDSDLSRLDSPSGDSANSSLSSTTALVLIHDSADDGAPFDFSEDDDDFSNDLQSERVRASAVPPLPPNTVFLYLLAPYLKIGALLLPAAARGLPMRYAVPALVGFALLSALTRQVWYMLARYVRKADMEEVVLDALARGAGKEGRRRVVRALVRLGTGAARVLVAAVYLRESVEALLPLAPDMLVVPPRIVLTVILAVIVLPLTWAKTVAFRRIVCAEGISVAAYVLWMALETYAQTHGTQTSEPEPKMGALWQSITTIACAFSTALTLPLYASLKGTVQPMTTASKYSPSFKILSILSVAVATGLLLPLVVASASSNLQASGFPSTYLMALLKVAILTSSIPALVITCPAIPMPRRMRRVSDVPLSKFTIFSIVAILSLAPEQASYVLQDVMLVIVLAGSYTAPALIHIIMYQFKRPLSIVMPHTPSLPRHRSSDSTPSHDELLQRKERKLQRRRLWRRIVWDVGVWAVLLPLSVGGFAWAGGRVAGAW